MKIWSQCGAVCIAPEDDEERQACEIAASSHLTIWTELPEWVVWLLRHKTWKTMHNQKRKETK